MRRSLANRPDPGKGNAPVPSSALVGEVGATATVTTSRRRG